MNEYEILLSYLDKQEKPKKKSEVFIKPKNIEENKTKKIIDECVEDNKTKIFKSSSLGFDADKFENLMRSRLIDDYKKMQSYERPYISVTELFFCIRKSYYSRLKYQTDLKKQFNFAYLDLINRVANAIHEYVQEIYTFSETEKTLVSEIYKVKGRVDAINEPFLYEIKTVDETKFDGLYVKEHYYQPLIYSYILNTEYNYNIKTITIVYLFRDKLKRKPVPFDLPLDDNLAKSFLEQAPVLHNCIARLETPEPINATEEQCRWCPYISFCEKDNSKMKKPFLKNKKKEEISLFPKVEKNKKDAVFLF